MMALLGQIQGTDPRHVVDFLLVGGFLVNTAVMIATLVRGNNVQRREVTMTEEFLRKSEWREIQKVHDERMAEVEAQVAAMRTETLADIRRIHDRLDSLPGEVIAILRNTGALR